jgi:predicted tellurium resistance membrane protein TerC
MDGQTWISRRLKRARTFIERQYEKSIWIIDNGGGKRSMTAACVLAFVLIDIFDALDIVDMVSVGKTTFILVTASVLATVALGSWSTASGVARIERVEYPRRTIAALLAVLGLKMITHVQVPVAPAVWLAVVGGLFGLGIAESTYTSRRPTGRS